MPCLGYALDVKYEQAIFKAIELFEEFIVLTYGDTHKCFFNRAMPAW